MAGGLITAEQVDQAVRAQVMWGGRLGTNLIELGVIDLDQLSRTLGLQHSMPSALARHFEKIDKDLQKLLSPDVAEKYSVIPLIKVGSGADEKVVVAALGPLEPKPIAIVADEMGYTPEQIVVTVAAELRIRYQLERAYNIPRSSRFMRARGPAFPQFQNAPDFAESSDVDIQPITDSSPEHAIPEELSRKVTTPVSVVRGERPPQILATPDPNRPATIDDLPELDVEPDPEPEPEPSEEELKARRTYLKTIEDGPPADESKDRDKDKDKDKDKALGRIALKRVATPPPVAAEEARSTGTTIDKLGKTLGEATRAIRRATDRDRVVDLMMACVEKFAPACDAAVILVVRGDAAIGWKGFSRAGRSFPEIAVPIDQSPLAKQVLDKRESVRCECDELDAIDALLFRALGGIEGQLVLVPIVIATEVMCVVAMIGHESTEVEAIATAGGAAFARLMRDASR